MAGEDIFLHIIHMSFVQSVEFAREETHHAVLKDSIVVNEIGGLTNIGWTDLRGSHTLVVPTTRLVSVQSNGPVETLTGERR